MTRPLRFVTAASLYDGHDASINIMRRVLQDQGVEVIHLGHNRSAEEIVVTAIQEDADAIAVSSYQGGHNEFFRYMKDLLQEKGAPWIRIFGGGGGVIVLREIDALHKYGIDRIFSPEDGRKLGIPGMIAKMIELTKDADRSMDDGDRLPQKISAMELGEAEEGKNLVIPVVGLTVNCCAGSWQIFPGSAMP